jgi:hypothetical protein
MKRLLLCTLLLALAARADTVIGGGGGVTFATAAPTSANLQQAWTNKRWLLWRPCSPNSNTNVCGPNGSAVAACATAGHSNLGAGSVAAGNPVIGLLLTTNGTLGCGPIGAAPITGQGLSPAYSAEVGLAQTTQTRLWAAVMGDATQLTGITGLSALTGPTAVGYAFAGIVYDSAIGANWRCCSSDASNYSCVDMGTAADTNVHVFNVTYINGGSVLCTLDGATTTKSTNKPPLTFNASGWLATSTLGSLDATNKSFTWGASTLETN